MLDWLTDHKLPVGKAAKAVFGWMNDNLGPVFDAISAMMEGLIRGILWLLQTPHPLVIIAFFVGLTWVLQRNWKVCLGVFVGFLFILNQGYWKPTTESLTLILSSCVVCMGLGVPIGIAAAHRPRLYGAMVPVLDLMQTLPTFVYLIPAIVFFGLGMVPGLIATVIFVLPAPIRLTRTGPTRDRDVMRTMFHFDEDYGSIMMRTGRLQKSAWAEDPPSRCRRFVSNVRIGERETAGEYEVVSYLFLERSRGDNPENERLTAERRDVWRDVDGAYKLVKREVIVDQSVLGMSNLAVFL